jgi:hypothetical protein
MADQNKLFTTPNVESPVSSIDRQESGPKVPISRQLGSLPLTIAEFPPECFMGLRPTHKDENHATELLLKGKDLGHDFRRSDVQHRSWLRFLDSYCQTPQGQRPRVYEWYWAPFAAEIHLSV